ncbi:MAG: YtxH domain-containing protein [Anaerolinea sp.]|nr:YtxH domain-containing protein [Anaerolinea sp.]
MKGKGHKKNEVDNNLSDFLAGLMFLAGLLLGSLIGAGVTLLLAPQSGKKTRKQIRRKGRDLRTQTTDAVDDTVAQVRAKAHQVTTNIHEQTEALQQRGQDVLDEGKERFAVVVKAGKTIVNGS